VRCFTSASRVGFVYPNSFAYRSGAWTFHRGPSVHVLGKGRKERALPLWKDTAADVRAWLACAELLRLLSLFLNAGGGAMTRAGFEYILNKHARVAAAKCPGLEGRTVSPHQLRHSCAVMMLQATRDIRKVALWLGHADVRTTEMYLRVDPSEKLEAIEAVLPLGYAGAGSKHRMR